MRSKLPERAQRWCLAGVIICVEVMDLLVALSFFPHK